MFKQLSVTKQNTHYYSVVSLVLVLLLPRCPELNGGAAADASDS